MLMNFEIKVTPIKLLHVKRRTLNNIARKVLLQSLFGYCLYFASIIQRLHSLEIGSAFQCSAFSFL